MMTFLYSEETVPAASVSTTPSTRPAHHRSDYAETADGRAAKALISTEWPSVVEAKKIGAISTPAPPASAALSP